MPGVTYWYPTFTAVEGKGWWIGWDSMYHVAIVACPRYSLEIVAVPQQEFGFSLLNACCGRNEVLKGENPAVLPMKCSQCGRKFGAVTENSRKFAHRDDPRMGSILEDFLATKTDPLTWALEASAVTSLVITLSYLLSDYDGSFVEYKVQELVELLPEVSDGD